MNYSDLPRSASALYKLSGAPAQTIQNGIKRRMITPTMTAREAKEFVGDPSGFDISKLVAFDSVIEGELLRAAISRYAKQWQHEVGLKRFLRELETILAELKAESETEPAEHPTGDVTS
jgi:hypothetical protein